MYLNPIVTIILLMRIFIYIKKITKPIFRYIMKYYLYFLFYILYIIYFSINILPFGKKANSLALNKIFERKIIVKDANYEYKFHTPNWLTYYRAKSIFNKEPETIKWLGQIPKNSVLWDIGANIGIFTIYAAKNGVNVVSVEPSFTNLEILHRNVILNKVNKTVSVIPFGLGNKTALETYFLSLSNLTWGGAHNSVGVNIGYDGKPLINPVEVKGIVYSIDDLLKLENLKKPGYLKIDVDGLELDVLKGAVNTLPNVKSILIEVDRDFLQQKEGVESLLKLNGFKLASETLDTQGTSNQIWDK
jgi:FkbM family methyltransferase